MLYNHIEPEVEKTFCEKPIIYKIMLYNHIEPEVEKTFCEKSESFIRLCFIITSNLKLRKPFVRNQSHL